MTYRLLSFVILLSTIFVSPVLAVAPNQLESPIKTPLKAPIIAQVKRSTPTPAISSLMLEKAEKYNISYQDLYDTISCESNFDIDVQSNHYANGKREESYGLSQINLPSNPQVTYEQAIDPEFAVEFMAYNFSKGRHYLWSCWKIVRPNGS